MNASEKFALADSMDVHASLIESAAASMRSNARILRASAEDQAQRELSDAAIRVATIRPEAQA